MAVQIIENLIDDLTGGEATETVSFALDGVLYTIDLNDKNATKLRKIFQPYVNAGEIASKQRGPRPEDTTLGRAKIRTWAWKNGHPRLASRGRIPAEIIAAYRRANPRG